MREQESLAGLHSIGRRLEMSDMIMPGISRGKKFFICDPAKNRRCPGRLNPHCGVQCFCTTNPEFAKDPSHPLTHEEYYKEEGARMRLIK